MRSNTQPVGQKRPSFIEEARRRQIVETAIQIIASQGFLQASLAEIAKMAGISKGVISYHFGGKEELVEEILQSLLRKPAEYIKQRVGECENALDKLTAYIEANFEFMEANRDNYVALVDLWGRRGSTGDHNHFNAEVYEPSRRYLSHILEEGMA
ncbi:MAG TPA: TetR family transcriptional regulator, partial [Vicinamibacteria bacterium]|nr:TetR family transcriptional regulator [Vicinamibacteria bacterium]